MLAGIFGLLGLIFMFAYFPRKLYQAFKINNQGELKRLLKFLALFFFAWLVIGMVLASSDSKSNHEVKTEKSEQSLQKVEKNNDSTAIKQTEQLKSTDKDKGKLETKNTKTDFTTCMVLQKQMTDDLTSSGNYKVIPIIQTEHISTVRFCANDGSVIHTCNGIDGLMSVTKSPHKNGCEKGKEVATTEQHAKSNTLGLLSQPKQTHATPHEQNKPAPQSSDSNCGSKRYCTQMTSCSEARHYLNQCGVSRLDRDGDGVPCESLCG